MADELPSLQIDTDWKKQAQEEKRRLAEKAQQAKAAQAAPAAGAVAAPAAAAGAGRREPVGEREAPQASFGAIVQSMMTQALYYLGEIAYRGSQPVLDLDMARYQHDLLTLLEQKTGSNLTADEQKLVDTALHEVRSRFIRTAEEYIAF